MVTAAGLAHANRLPVLLLPGDTFAGRAPDPVLQQVEHYGDPTITVNDAFRPVSRYFDRITRPEQLLATLPQVARVLTDPADAGPVVLALPQDVQVEEFDFPVAMFDPAAAPGAARPRPTATSCAAAAALLRGASARCSSPAAACATPAPAPSAARASPSSTACRSSRPSPAAPWCRTTTRCTAARSASSARARPTTLAAEADVVLAVGTRLQDFTTVVVDRRSPPTCAWSRSTPPASTRSSTRAHAVVGDARETLVELATPLAGWRRGRRLDGAGRRPSGRAGTRTSTGCAPATAPDGALTYAQVVGVVNDASAPDDYVLGSSGGIPGELHGGWRTGPATDRRHDGPRVRLLLHGLRDRRAVGRRDGPRGRPTRTALVTAIFGDGSYLMLNSELYSAAFAGHPFVAVVCDNGGYAVIHRLQTGQGADGFNNLLADCAGPGAATAASRSTSPRTPRSLGCPVEDVPAGAWRRGPPRPPTPAPARRRSAQRRPAVVVCRVAPSDLDRVRRLVGDRRPRLAVRPGGVRRGQGPAGQVVGLILAR